MTDISALIVVKDNPPYLEKTLRSIQDLVQEIVIADIGIDRTVLSKLKKNKLVKIVTVDKPVPYVELIREELKQYVSREYMLLLDPDEILPVILTEHLRSIYRTYDFIRIPRKNIIFHKWIQHSRWWPDYQVRLFRKNAVSWPKKIHQQPETKGNGYTVESSEDLAIIHHNYESVDEFMQKALRYAKSEAGELRLGKRPFSLADAFRKSLSEFISRYFDDEGYKDGMHGLVLSLLQMVYYLLVYMYYWEKNSYNEEDLKTIQISVHSFFSQGLYSINHWQNKINISTYSQKLKRKIVNRLLK